MLAYLEPGADLPNAAVVVLTEPRLEVGRLSYAFDLLKGAVPSQSGPVTLFIDPFGMPLSPISACGMRRRERRRVRRRVL